MKHLRKGEYSYDEGQIMFSHIQICTRVILKYLKLTTQALSNPNCACGKTPVLSPPVGIHSYHSNVESFQF